MSVELLHRVKALKKQGFDVFFTSDSDGVILNIRKKRSRVPFTQSWYKPIINGTTSCDIKQAISVFNIHSR